MPQSPAVEASGPVQSITQAAVVEASTIQAVPVAVETAESDHAVPTLAPIGFAQFMPKPEVQPALAPVAAVSAAAPMPPSAISPAADVPAISTGTFLTMDALAPTPVEQAESQGWLSSGHFDVAAAAPVAEGWLSGPVQGGHDFLGAPELTTGARSLSTPTAPLAVEPLAPPAAPVPAAPAVPPPPPVPAVEPARPAVADPPLPPPALTPHGHIDWETVSISIAPATEQRETSSGLALVPIDAHTEQSERRREVPGGTYFTSSYSDVTGAIGRVERLPFSFKGTGGDFFPIWIVNLILSLLTLGVFSAWAKVRTRQYFSENTQLEGGGFVYKGDPLAVFKGRMLLAILLGLTVFFARDEQLVQWVVVSGGVILLAIPWLLWSTLRFKAASSSYRNVRFSFHGGLFEAYWLFFQALLLVPVTMGLILPYLWYRWHQYVVSNLRFGTLHFEFVGQVGLYYRALLLGYLMLLMGAFGVAAVIPEGQLMPDAMALVVTGGYLLVWAAYMKVVATNLLFGNSRMGPHWLEGGFRLRSYLGVLVLNLFFTALTLGFYRPWAKVRMARYQAEHVVVRMSGSVERVVADQQQRSLISGDNMADAFDVDLSL